MIERRARRVAKLAHLRRAEVRSHQARLEASRAELVSNEASWNALKVSFDEESDLARDRQSSAWDGEWVGLDGLRKLRLDAISWEARVAESRRRVEKAVRDVETAKSKENGASEMACRLRDDIRRGVDRRESALLEEAHRVLRAFSPIEADREGGPDDDRRASRETED